MHAKAKIIGMRCTIFLESILHKHCKFFYVCRQLKRYVYDMTTSVNKISVEFHVTFKSFHCHDHCFLRAIFCTVFLCNLLCICNRSESSCMCENDLRENCCTMYLAGCERCSAKPRSSSEKNYCEEQEEIITVRFDCGCSHSD